MAKHAVMMVPTTGPGVSPISEAAVEVLGSNTEQIDWDSNVMRR